MMNTNRKDPLFSMVYTKYISFNFLLAQSLGMKCLYKHQDLQLLVLKYISNFHPLEVVVRGSKTQLQVGFKLDT